MKSHTKKPITNAQYVASARAFVGSYFDPLVHMCGLNSTDNWKVWYDDYGYQLRIMHDKSLKISTCEPPETVKDVYAKSSPKIISQNSYWCYYLGNENDSVFLFVGKDGILRCFSIFEGVKETRPPLSCGPKILKSICSNYTIDFGVINNIEPPDFGGNFIPEVGYMTSWPPENEAITYLEETIGQR